MVLAAKMNVWYDKNVEMERGKKSIKTKLKHKEIKIWKQAQDRRTDQILQPILWDIFNSDQVKEM